MLKLAGTPEQFLDRHWQKSPLVIRAAVPRRQPSLTRNELAWLATLDDVESRLVFTDRRGERTRYRAEAGPFDESKLASLPKRDWTLLVHDVEKHLPDMRRLFSLVPFIPDWRIDDLMVSFAAPGGGVGPHRDNYDVFLCQGIGTREWRITTDEIDADPAASDELALTREFAADSTYGTSQGDVLYLPPGVVHWGTALRASITYSIGMRAPRLSDLGGQTRGHTHADPFYSDPDLRRDEARPGYIAPEATGRARRIAGDCGDKALATALGRFATTTKPWITPEPLPAGECEEILAAVDAGLSLRVHGMARLAWDDARVYVNGRCRALPGGAGEFVAGLCADRRAAPGRPLAAAVRDLLRWMLEAGAFETPCMP